MCGRFMEYFRLRDLGWSASSASQNTPFRKLNVNTKNNEYRNNVVTTGKYNLFTFIPIFTFVQLRKTANVFFVIICILQQIPDVSPTGRFTTLMPFAFILSVAAVKEIFEDYKRHFDDRTENNKKTPVFHDGRFVATPWKDICVGDVVKVVNGQFFPADLILLSSSDPQSMCYVETAMLDGETNLKIRQGLKETSELQSVEKLNDFHGQLQCDFPNNNLYDFNGNITMDDEEQLSLGLGQTLLRGCMLRNTAWIYGVVVYTGHETKIMMNSKKNPMKRSTVEKTTNTQIIYLLVILMIAALASTIGNTIFKNTNSSDSHWYIPKDTENASFFFTFLTFIIVYNNLVPISLMVTLEVVKYVQASFINNDIAMYYAVNDTPARAKTSNLNEELGQIEYIFTDKTGTLTQNIMEFRKATVAGVSYGDTECACFDDVDFREQLLDKKSVVSHFTRMMAVCHTVVPEVVSTNEHERNMVTYDIINKMRQKANNTYTSLEYQSSSPDENAIIKAAKNLGFVFCVRSPNDIMVDELGVDRKYEILNVLEFSSGRKRMSVIVRNHLDEIWLMCKGADEVIFPRLVPDSKFKDETMQHLNLYAAEGLRTLCFAQAKLDEYEYQEWNATRFVPAYNSVLDRDRLLEAAYDEIEKDLELLGASAIEDKLQDGVPATIEILLQANIKIWVLTGDKVETAINIANSCKLIDPSMQIIILDEPTIEVTMEKMEAAIDQIGKNNLRKNNNLGLVVSGFCLKHALKNCDMLLDIALSCKSVLCCRVSPIQKAEIVELVREKEGAVTLAIGDGGNDVSMIQSADVGVGISGMEGLQAANASDYSIAQFRFLQTLLLVHGAWNYSRLAKCILYSFYKNICLYLIQLWFAFFNGFTGQILFERWTIACYNAFFTAFQPFAIGILDRTFDRDVMLNNPKLYLTTQTAVNFNGKVFWGMCLNATVHSAMLFFIPASMLGYASPMYNGKSTGYLFLGNMVYTYVVITVSLKAGLETFSWTVYTHMAIWGSIMLWFIFMITYQHFWPTLPVGTNFVGLSDNIFESLHFWFGCIFFPFIVLYRDIVWKVLKRHVFGNSEREMVRNAEKQRNSQQHQQHVSTPCPNSASSEHSPTVNTNERASLLHKLKSAEFTTTKTSTSTNKQQQISTPMEKMRVSKTTGYAFSQDEKGTVSQSELILRYGTATTSASLPSIDATTSRGGSRVDEVVEDRHQKKNSMNKI